MTNDEYLEWQNNLIHIMMMLKELSDAKMISGGEYQITMLGISAYDQMVAEGFEPNREMVAAILPKVPGIEVDQIEDFNSLLIVWEQQRQYVEDDECE